jgi:hypothetical protein
VTDELDDQGVSDPDAWGVSLEAHMLVHGDRGSVYAHPMEMFARTVDIFESITGQCLTPAEGALFMTSLKLARIATALDAELPPELWRDSIVDLAGYADTLDAIMTWEMETCDDDDDDDDGGDDDEPEPLPMPGGGDGEEVKPVPEVLVALVEDIDPEPGADGIDITSNQAPPPVC